jgi:uncharacterized protein
MELEHTFTVPVGVDEAFRVLRDIDRIGPCMPGATIDSVEGDEFSGRVKVKVGPIQVTYQGTAAFVEVDEELHSAIIEAKAKETRGTGTANAMIRATCVAKGEDRTEVNVLTDLAITGKPAQFGRGVMADVGDKLLGRFADALAAELSTGDAEEEQVPEAAPSPEQQAAPSPEQQAAAGVVVGSSIGPSTGTATPLRPAAPRRSAEAIDLLDVAGAPILKRAVPVAGGVLLLWLIIWLIRRR